MADRAAVIKRTVEDLLMVEGSIGKLLDDLRPVVRAHPVVIQYLQELAQMVERQRETLATHLGALSGSGMPSPRTPTVLLRADLGGHSIARALQAAYGAFHYATVSYAAAFEVALRLYDPPLRKIAPEHLKSYVNGTQRLERWLASWPGSYNEMGWSVTASVLCAASVPVDVSRLGQQHW